MKNYIILCLCMVFISCNSSAQKKGAAQNNDKDNIQKDESVSKKAVAMNNEKIQKTDAEWKALLTDAEYRVLRKAGTEAPHTGKYDTFSKAGKYYCAACNALLFNSDSKFKSNCGWPSFDQAIPGSVEYIKDYSLGMARTEVVCATCGGHLGHVFKDGPTETGNRYCMNSVSLNFEPLKK